MIKTFPKNQQKSKRDSQNETLAAFAAAELLLSIQVAQLLLEYESRVGSILPRVFTIFAQKKLNFPFLTTVGKMALVRQ